MSVESESGGRPAESGCATAGGFGISATAGEQPAASNGRQFDNADSGQALDGEQSILIDWRGR